MPVLRRDETARVHATLRAFMQKVDSSRALVRTALDRATRPYIAGSSGKDSTCVAHLVWEVNPDVPYVYFDADCAYPESKAYLDHLAAAGRTVIRWQAEPMMETFKRLGGPTAPGVEEETMKSTVYRPIQALQAEYAFDTVFVGLRAEESAGRRRLIRARGRDFWNGRDKVHEVLPVAYWSFWDVWAYITTNDHPYNAIYDKMLDLPIREQRVSYWAGETNASSGRWKFLRRHYPALWQQLVDLFPEVSTFM